MDESSSLSRATMLEKYIGKQVTIYDRALDMELKGKLNLISPYGYVLFWYKNDEVIYTVISEQMVSWVRENV